MGESGTLISGLVDFKMNRWAVLVYSQSTRLNADQGKAVDTDKYQFSHLNNHRTRISQAVSIHIATALPYPRLGLYTYEFIETLPGYKDELE